MSERQDLRDTVADLVLISLVATIVLPIVYILDGVHIN